jgi:hypothetical protein
MYNSSNIIDSFVFVVNLIFLPDLILDTILTHMEMKEKEIRETTLSSFCHSNLPPTATTSFPVFHDSCML